MKKRITLLFIILSLLCLLSACGKTPQVQNAEKLINEIGEITLESGKQIDLAGEAFGALSDTDKKKVKNQDLLAQAYIDYCNLVTESIESIGDSFSDDFDIKSGYETLEIIKANYPTNYIFEEIGTDMIDTIDGVMSLIESMCYPDSFVLRLDNFYNTSRVSQEEANGSNGFYIYNYLFSSKSDAQNAISNYVTYLNQQFSLTSELTDFFPMYTFETDEDSIIRVSYIPVINAESATVTVAIR